MDCSIIQLTDDIKEMAIRLKQVNKLKLPDAVIAATAICNDLPILTADKGFKQIKQLDLLLIV